MVVLPPEGITPCVTCGDVPRLGFRFHYLAGCLESHDVGVDFDIGYLGWALWHKWEDRTYAATRLEHRGRTVNEAKVLAWLEAVHAGTVERRPFPEWGEQPIFDPFAFPDDERADSC